MFYFNWEICFLQEDESGLGAKFNRKRSSRPEVFYEKGVLINVAKFTEKHLCRSLFIKKEIWISVFSCEFCKIFKTTFLKRTI